MPPEWWSKILLGFVSVAIAVLAIWSSKDLADRVGRSRELFGGKRMPFADRLPWLLLGAIAALWAVVQFVAAVRQLVSV